MKLSVSERIAHLSEVVSPVLWYEPAELQDQLNSASLLREAMQRHPDTPAEDLEEADAVVAEATARLRDRRLPVRLKAIGVEQDRQMRRQADAHYRALKADRELRQELRDELLAELDITGKDGLVEQYLRLMNLGEEDCSEESIQYPREVLQSVANTLREQREVLDSWSQAGTEQIDELIALLEDEAVDAKWLDYLMPFEAHLTDQERAEMSREAATQVDPSESLRALDEATFKRHRAVIVAGRQSDRKKQRLVLEQQSEEELLDNLLKGVVDGLASRKREEWLQWSRIAIMVEVPEECDDETGEPLADTTWSRFWSDAEAVEAYALGRNDATMLVRWLSERVLERVPGGEGQVVDRDPFRDRLAALLNRAWSHSGSVRLDGDGAGPAGGPSGIAGREADAGRRGSDDPVARQAGPKKTVARRPRAAAKRPDPQ